MTHPIGQRCTDDQPTIKGRTSANFGYSKPLFAYVHRTFGDQFIASAACNFFLNRPARAKLFARSAKGLIGGTEPVSAPLRCCRGSCALPWRFVRRHSEPLFGRRIDRPLIFARRPRRHLRAQMRFELFGQDRVRHHYFDIAVRSTATFGPSCGLRLAVVRLKEGTEYERYGLEEL